MCDWKIGGCKKAVRSQLVIERSRRPCGLMIVTATAFGLSLSLLICYLINMHEKTDCSCPERRAYMYMYMAQAWYENRLAGQEFATRLCMEGSSNTVRQNEYSSFLSRNLYKALWRLWMELCSKHPCYFCAVFAQSHKCACFYFNMSVLVEGGGGGAELRVVSILVFGCITVLVCHWNTRYYSLFKSVTLLKCWFTMFRHAVHTTCTCKLCYSSWQRRDIGCEYEWVRTSANGKTCSKECSVGIFQSGEREKTESQQTQTQPFVDRVTSRWLQKMVEHQIYLFIFQDTIWHLTLTTFTQT